MEQVKDILDSIVEQVSTLDPPALVRMAAPPPVIEIIVDRSGSMQGTIGQLMLALQEVVQDQHRKFPRALVNVTLFNNEVAHLPERTLGEIMMTGFAPVETAGATALFKAIHATILRAYERFKDGRFLFFIVVTDGEDNASGSISAHHAKKMVQYAETHNGSVLFLGANSSILEQAAAAGIKYNLEFDPGKPCAIQRETSNHLSSELERGTSTTSSAPVDEDFLMAEREAERVQELPPFLRDNGLEGIPMPPALTRSFTVQQPY
jgi:hypothetical protein